jgi:hypothetical protein
VGHGGLDGADARRGGVFAGLGVIVEEIWGAVTVLLVLSVEVEEMGAYSVSSGRDMFAVEPLPLFE